MFSINDVEAAQARTAKIVAFFSVIALLGVLYVALGFILAPHIDQSRALEAYVPMADRAQVFGGAVTRAGGLENYAATADYNRGVPSATPKWENPAPVIVEAVAPVVAPVVAAVETVADVVMPGFLPKTSDGDSIPFALFIGIAVLLIAAALVMRRFAATAE